MISGLFSRVGSRFGLTLPFEIIGVSSSVVPGVTLTLRVAGGASRLKADRFRADACAARPAFAALRGLFRPAALPALSSFKSRH